MILLIIVFFIINTLYWKTLILAVVAVLKGGTIISLYIYIYVKQAGLSPFLPYWSQFTTLSPPSSTFSLLQRI